MIYPQSDMVHKGKKYHLTWIRTDSIDNYSPITQVYGICFTKNNEILVCRSSETSQWMIPGGSPENDETVEQTLKRELLEEVDIKVKNIKILGAQKVESLERPEPHYQVRCVSVIDELLPQTIDPANGKVWERKLIPMNKVAEYVQWGDTGNAMFKDAIELFNISNETAKL